MKKQTVIKTALSLALASSLTVSPAFAVEGVTLLLGKLKTDDTAHHQLVAVASKRNQTIERIEVQCGFFLGELLVGAKNSDISNLEPNTEAYAEITMSADEDADSARCRIVSAD